MTFEQTFRIYEIFNFYFKNEADAKALASEIEGLVNNRIGFEKAELATKDDIAKLELATKNDITELRLATKNDITELRLATEKDIAELRTATEKDIAELRTATKNDIAELRLTTKNDIAEVKGEIKQLEIKMGEGFKDILKWMIALMVGFASLILTFAKILD